MGQRVGDIRARVGARSLCGDQSRVLGVQG